MCIDYWGLNKIILMNCYPLSGREELPPEITGNMATNLINQGTLISINPPKVNFENP